MTKNTKTETAQKGQAVNNIQTKNNKEQSKVPTGKVILLKETESRKKAREEQYKNFRVSALRRRCARMGCSEEKTEEFVKKLLEQLKAPKEYSILIMLNPKDGAMMMEALAKAKIQYKYRGDTFFSIDGNQDILDKIREIAPTSAKIHPYAKKMESVISKEEIPKKPKTPKEKTAPHSRPKGKNVAKKRPNVAGMSKKNRKIFKAQVKTLRKKWKAEKASKKKTSTTVQLNPENASTATKKASTTLKKAA